MSTPSPTHSSLAGKPAPAEAGASGCCGGSPLANTTACCALDEAHKAAGRAGCGCAAASMPDAPSTPTSPAVTGTQRPCCTGASA